MTNLIFFIYDVVFFVGLVIYLPFYVRRKKITLSAFKEKLGFLKKNDFPQKESIWIQVVSVGEVNLIENLVKRIHELFDFQIVITTTTLTGNKLAQKKYGSLAKVFFFPFDISFIIKRIFSFINPKIFIAIETEVWPNLFYRLKKRGVPIVIINARISDKAFKRYKLIQPAIGNILRKCDCIGAQNQKYKDRFIHLGANNDKTFVSGNMKFDSINVDEKRLEALRNKYLKLLKKDDSLLIVAGSTHPPEEELLITLYNEITSKIKNVTLLIAPRHIERVNAIEKSVVSSGFRPVRLSTLSCYAPQEENIFLLDSIGELLYFYAIADICFVGGSISDYGGHNILEPIFFSKPTVFGPHMNNFKDIEEIILSKKAGIRVTDINALKETLILLINDKKEREKLRLNCLDVFANEKKVLEENLKIILKCIE